MGRRGSRRGSAGRSWTRVHAGRPVAEVTQAARIVDQSIYSWCRQVRIDRGVGPGLTNRIRMSSRERFARRVCGGPAPWLAALQDQEAIGGKH
jgi:hypothetical protein